MSERMTWMRAAQFPERVLQSLLQGQEVSGAMVSLGVAPP